MTSTESTPPPRDAAPASVTRAGQRGWARVFGYDVFISFALGPAPRGCRAYASDLARRLREQGFTVFFSEDEAPVGVELDGTLRRALRRSRILVVVANRATLADPRWVRTEVEEYRRSRPGGAVVPINVDGALLDPALAEHTQTWMPFAGRIWVDETAEACESGRVSDDTVQRLVTAPHAVRSVVRLRSAVGATLVGFALLALFALLQRNEAVGERDRAQQALLSSSARQALLLARDGRAHEGWNGLVEALAQAQPQVNGPLPKGFLEAALTTLVEDRRGPDLVFDSSASAPPQRDDGELVPPPAAFDAHSVRVAVAAGTQLAVWSTADGQRLTQVTLPFVAEQLTFAGGGELVVAEGTESVAAGSEGIGTPRAAAVDVASGRVTLLPLSLCEHWVPCIAGKGRTTHLRPLAELPVTALLENELAQGTAYMAAAAGEVRLKGLSGERFVLLSREPGDADRTWWLLDRRSGGTLQLNVRLGAKARVSASNYSLARQAPVLVASGMYDSALMVYRIEAGPLGPRLVKWRELRARFAAATQGVRLDDQGATLRYQNFRYGTGTGVGLGRTVVLDVASGREVWARGEGEVAWGETLVALQENWAETQVLAADTGATWFLAPGRPLSFDPAGRMLLMWDNDDGGEKASPWPRVRLLEALPVRQFAHDVQGPASVRSICVPTAGLPFLTLAERPDRIWNHDDWHRVARAGATVAAASGMSNAAARPLPTASTKAQRVYLHPVGKHWRLLVDEEDGNGTLLAQTQVQQRFPLLAADLSPGKDLYALLTTSADGNWSAVVTQGGDAACEGWARWRLYRGQDTVPVKSGCTAGEQPGPDSLPGVWFLPKDAEARTPMLVIVPAETCRYDMLEPERGEVRSAVEPVFGNNVSIERLAPDLLAVYSTDWYGATVAYQVQGLGSERRGPVFVMAERNEGDGNATEMIVSPTKSRTLVDAEQDFTTATFAPDGRTLGVTIKKGEEALPTTLGVPAWGDRLRERLRQAVLRRGA